MTFLFLIFSLSIIGISETAYLIRKRVASEKPLCPIVNGCDIALTSKYNRIFIIPNDILGLLSYVIISIFAAFLVMEIQPIFLWDFFLKILIAIASLFSFFLTYLQWRVIRAWCFWCLMSAFTIWLMGIIILLNEII